jgi:hypothetical protein
VERRGLAFIALALTMPPSIVEATSLQGGSGAAGRKDWPMETDQKAPTYRVWGTDKVIYGPVDLPALVNWTKQGRVGAEAWVFCDAEDRWQKAAEVPELKMFLAARPQPGQTTGFQAAARPAINPASLRRIKTLAGLDQTQLASFLQYVQVVSCRQFSHVVRKGEHGDAMYLVLEGELRALTIVDGKQTTLATMKAGDFFGEISLLDQAPRSADVVANQDSTLLRSQWRTSSGWWPKRRPWPCRSCWRSAGSLSAGCAR